MIKTDGVIDSSQSYELSASSTSVEVALVFRHFHPILAGAAERFRRYSVPLADQGVHYRVFTLQEDERHPRVEQMHTGLRVQRLPAKGIPWVRDAALFQAASHYLSSMPPEGRMLQTSLAHDLSRPWLSRIRRHGVSCLYVGTMVGREEPGLPLWRRWVQKWKSKRNFAPFHKVVASTTVMARWFESSGVSRDRIEVIPNGVDVGRFRPVANASEKSQLRETLRLPKERPVVIFAGSIVPRKGVELLIRAWPQVLAAVPEATLVLVGGFDRPTFMTQERMQELSRFQESMRSLAAQPKCRSSITFAGESDHLEDWLRAADVFAFPSEQEGMGNVVLEAMACGLPCVITQFHGMPEEEFGTADREFILVPRDEISLVEGLVDVLAEESKRAALGNAARRWTCDKMDVRLTIQAYHSLYHSQAAGV